jgi:hypothetical protein
MAKFISIPVTSKGTTIINVDNITATQFNTATGASAIVIVAGGKYLALTISGATTTEAFEAVNDAITDVGGGPVLYPVVFPTGVTCTAIVATT